MVNPIIFTLLTILGIGLGLKVTTTQNPVYSGLYLVLLFFLGSGIAFVLGLEFMALLFLLVYAGAIAVLVLFVVMMLDVKAIENPWSAEKKKFIYLCGFVFLFGLISMFYSDDLQELVKSSILTYLISFFSIASLSYEDYLKTRFFSMVAFEKSNKSVELNSSLSNVYVNKESVQVMPEVLENRVDFWKDFCDSEGLLDFFNLLFRQDQFVEAFEPSHMWFVEFDSSCALNDPSYLLYTTYAILLIIAGVVLLIAMVGAISLTLQKNCPESLYRQLGRESKNAVFLIKENPGSQVKTIDD